MVQATTVQSPNVTHISKLSSTRHYERPTKLADDSVITKLPRQSLESNKQ